ncbi:uncharacterized protein BJX67DRAFT_380557 [Aspergillus lucknowensis]|uniref:Uncharacterized protein n=1 Tax=Aspergillus lucknowensis TaxID=176173 RepID=A0ABR4LV03_9EURO
MPSDSDDGASHSDQPKCLCHPRPIKPFQKLELVIRGSKPEQVCRLDQPKAQLDVVFELIGNTVSLRETVEDPTILKGTYSICLVLDTKKMRFENLIGLPNRSLLLTFRMRTSICAVQGRRKMLYKEKFEGFSASPPYSKLYNDFYLCDWSEQRLELLLPAERIVGWKTAALILKTFQRITPESWCHLVNMRHPPSLAGLDWREIERTLMPEKEEALSISTPDEEKEMHFLIEKKKAEKEAQKKVVFIRY